MSKIFQNIKLSIDANIEDTVKELAPNFSSYRIIKKSIDARRRHELHQVLSLEIFFEDEKPNPNPYQLDQVEYKGAPVVVVGTGPAGLFAAIRLVERGIPCILLERGSECNERMKKINRYWRYNELNAEDNVCFGEGGAGLYSDGKLITRIKSEHISYVMQRLVDFGAPEEILYLANPHVGSDRIRRLIPKIRQFLSENKCQIRFNSKLTDLIIENNQVVGAIVNEKEKIYSPHIILATGHSADDVFDMLAKQNVFMEGKSFAMGLRIEHPQSYINQTQYRQHANHPSLGAANYKVTYYEEDTQIGVYSFCMCPGGYVLSSTTAPESIVCNGMSNYLRNSPFANAAIVVSMDYEKHFKKELMAGLKYRNSMEKRAYQMVQKAGGTKELPAQNAEDFLNQRVSDSIRKGSSPSHAVSVDLAEVLGEHLSTKIREGLENFEAKMPGFTGKDVVLYGVESRTSCPIRVTRDPVTLESLSHKGLYPAGEGAGYAGGITSAACDGIKIADVIFQKIKYASLPSNFSQTQGLSFTHP